MRYWLLEIVGTLVVVSTLLDVFLKVLYARSGWGFITVGLGRLTWRGFRLATRVFPRKRRHLVLSFAGPTLLVEMAGVWVAGLTLGFGLIAWPNLGTTIKSATSPTETDFWTAVWFAGDSITTVGTGDMTPRTAPMKMVMTLASVFGITVLTLTVTYYLEVYNAVMRRNKTALKLEHLTRRTGDAAEMVGALGSGGNLESARPALAEIGVELIDLYESHHLYPVLQYFHFEKPYYVGARMMLVAIDALSLMRSGAHSDYDYFKKSGAMTVAWGAAMRLLTETADHFLPEGYTDEAARRGAEEEDRWRRRYRAALGVMRQAGIRTPDDEEEGANAYVEFRREWEPYVGALAAYMMLDPAETDTAGQAV